MFQITRLYVLPIEPVPSVSLAELLSFTSEEKRAKLQKFHRQDDLLRGLWADLLLRKLIIEDHQVSNSQIRFEFNPYGKPQLWGVDNYHFNVSHSGKWVACLLDREPVGVDVEQIQSFDEAVARSFFAEEEYRFIMEASDNPEKQQRFYQVWTAKESYIKARGKGLSIKLDSFSVMTSEGVEGLKRIGGEEWRIKSFLIDSAYSLTTCYKATSTWANGEIVASQQIIECLRSVNC